MISGDDDDPNTFIVLDHGSWSTKCGFAGADNPRSVSTSCVGRSKKPGTDGRPYYWSAEAGYRSNIYSLFDFKYPIEHGIITDWEFMEGLWHETFYNALKVDPKDKFVMITEPPLNPKATRDRIAKMMFETLKVSAAYIYCSAALSLFASQRVTGCVVDVGHTATHIVSICEGYVIPHTIIRLDLGGRDLTEHLTSILNERGYSLTTPADKEIVRDIKESMCFVAVDFEQEMKKAASSSALHKAWEMPCGTMITLKNERFRCPEVLFHPSLAGFEIEGVARTTMKSIMKCDSSIHDELFRNIVLAGGSTLFPHFDKRMLIELTALTQVSAKIEIVAPPQRMYSAWHGGRMLAKLLTEENQSFWITKEEYNRAGPSIVEEKRSWQFL